MPSVATVGVRRLTGEEVSAYTEQGWVKLDAFLSTEATAALLTRVVERMGEDAARVADTRNRPAGTQRGGLGAGAAPSSTTRPQEMFRPYMNPSREDEWIYALSHSSEMARVGASIFGKPARFYNGQVMCKAPAAQDGGKTPWHQDLPYHPFDRRGRMTVWVALVDCPPNKGTLRFLTGSHMLPPLGRYVSRADGLDMVDDNPWLLERYEVSPPLHLRAGDATLHDSGIVHSAPENTTDQLRWVYSVTMFPHDVLYTGLPQGLTDGIGLTINQPFDHPDFPILKVPGSR